jgi:hypothetical protein
MKTIRFEALLLLSLICACSKQGEGDTCLLSNGNGDCADDLICTAYTKLASSNDGDYPADRCCPDPKDRLSKKSACKLIGNSETDNDGAGGAAGSTSTAGGATSSTAGGNASTGGNGNEGGNVSTTVGTAGSGGTPSETTSNSGGTTSGT